MSFIRGSLIQLVTRQDAAEAALESSLSILRCILKEYKEELGMTTQGESGAARDLNIYEKMQDLNELIEFHANLKKK